MLTRASRGGRDLLLQLGRKLDRPALLLLSLFSALVAGVNIGGWYVLHFIDILWPLNPGGNLSDLQFSWSPVNLGTYTFVNAFNYPLAVWLYALGSLGVPAPIQEWVTLALLQLIGGYFFFIFVRRFVLPSHSSSSYVVAICASFAYLVNYYVLTVGWWDNVPGFFWLLGFGPPFAYFALDLQSRILAKSAISAWRVSALSVSSFFAFSTNVPFNVSLLALAVVLPPLTMIGPFGRVRAYLSRVALGYLLVGAVILLTSLWWIVPDYLQSVYVPNYVGGGYATSYNLALFTSSSSGNSFVTVLTGLYGVEYAGYAHTSLANAIYTGIAGPSSLLIGLLIIAGLLIAPGGSVRRRQAVLVGGIVVVSLLFLGVNSPIALALEYLLESNSIALQALRNPFLSFGFAISFLIILTFAHSVELAIQGFARLDRRTEARREEGSARVSSVRNVAPRVRRVALEFHPAVTAVVAVLLFTPLFAAGGPAVIGNAVPGAPFEARTVIPSYEYEVANFLSARLGNSYALLYPGGFLEQNWTHGYDGYDLLPSLLPRAFLIYDSGNGFVASPNTMLSYAYSSIQTGTTHLVDFAGLMSRLGVSTIVVEGQVGGSYPFGFNAPPNYSLVLGSLNQTPGLGHPIAIGADTIYLTNSTPSIATSEDESVNASALGGGTIVPQVDITSLYANASAVSSPVAPTPIFPLTATGAGYEVQVGTGARTALAVSPLGAPLSQFGQPIVFNGAPMPISTGSYDSISINFSTSEDTAITVAVIDVSNLSGLNSSGLARHLFVLGGAASNLGLGTPSLFSAYGADHFWTNGTAITLTDDLRQTLYPVANGTVYYILFFLFPVVDGRGTPGIPVANWSGTQGLTINSITLGNPFYAPSTVSSQSVAISIPGGPKLENLTAEYVSSAINQTSSTAPKHNFLPNVVNESLVAVLNQSAKVHLGSTPLGPPFGAGFPPSVYNDNPIQFPLSTYSYLNVAFSTNNATALTLALVGRQNLTALSPSSLSNVTVVLGGEGNSEGFGDEALFPAFGADHFYSPTGVSQMSQSLADLSASPVSPSAFYLIFSMFPVAANGTGIRFLPVQSWPGVQSIAVYSIVLSSYLIDGRPQPEPGTFFGPAPEISWKGANPFDPHTVIATTTLPPLHVMSSVTISQENFVTYRVNVQSSASTDGPLLIVFDQNFASGWRVSGVDVRNYTHLEVDAGLNGFVIYLTQNVTAFGITLFFAGQAAYTLALQIGFGAAAFAALAPLALVGIRRFTKRRATAAS